MMFVDKKFYDVCLKKIFTGATLHRNVQVSLNSFPELFFYLRRISYESFHYIR